MWPAAGRSVEAPDFGRATRRVRLAGDPALEETQAQDRRRPAKPAARGAADSPELALLREWTEERLRQWCPSEDPFLFSVPALAPGLVPARSVLTQIHRVMRTVTGDDTLRYHHLRHSFATWSFLRLMISDLQQPLDLFPHLPKTTAWLAEAKEFRTRLYQHDCRTRSYAYAIASLLGHSAPDISFEHYIHSLDWILSSYLHSARSAAPKRPVVRASGRPASTVYSWLGDNDLSEATRRLFAARYPDRVPVPSRTGISPPSSEFREHTDVKATWVRSVWEFLHAHSSTGTPLHELATEFELEQMERMLARACASGYALGSCQRDAAPDESVDSGPPGAAGTTAPLLPGLAAPRNGSRSNPTARRAFSEADRNRTGHLPKSPGPVRSSGVEESESPPVSLSV